MKKVLAILIATVMLATLVLSVSAAEDNFVPSITVKPAPDVSGNPDDNGRVLIGQVVDENGNVVCDVYGDCIVITPISKVNTDVMPVAEADGEHNIVYDGIPPEAAQLLKDVYAEISAEGFDFSTMNDQLNKLVEKDLGEGKDANDLVITEVFDITAICEELRTHLPVDGNVLTLTFKGNYDDKTPFYAMNYIDGEWQMVEESVVNANGSVSITFEDFCPVVFMIPADQDGDTSSPQTGDTTDNTLWVFIMIASLAVIAVLAVAIHRNSKREQIN